MRSRQGFQFFTDVSERSVEVLGVEELAGEFAIELKRIVKFSDNSIIVDDVAIVLAGIQTVHPGDCLE